MRFTWLAPTLGIFLLSACDQASESDQANAPPPPAPQVGVSEVKLTDLSPSEDFIGRIEAVDEVQLRARVEGFLMERNFEEGAAVSEGDVLFRIEPDVYRTEVARLEATITGDIAQVDLAALERDRQEKLVQREVTAQSALDEAIAQEAADNATLDQNRALLQRAELDLSYTEIIAPFDGTIGRAAYSEGELVGPQSEPLATLVRLDPVYARVNISVRQLLEFQAREEDENSYQPLLELADGSMYETPGEWAFAEPEVDPATDTVAIRALFPNPNGVLLPGAFVTLKAQRTETVSSLVVPQGAVQDDQAGSFVMVISDDNTAQMRRVQLGDQVDADWIVNEGLEEGDVVIVQGLQKIRPGAVVDAVPAETGDELEG